MLRELGLAAGKPRFCIAVLAAVSCLIVFAGCSHAPSERKRLELSGENFWANYTANMPCPESGLADWGRIVWAAEALGVEPDKEGDYNLSVFLAVLVEHVLALEAGQACQP